jgi:hypothetical protein
MAPAPTAGWGFFPLDETLGLGSRTRTPGLESFIVELSAWLPFGRAAELIRRRQQVSLSEPTARRSTEATGAALAEAVVAEAERIVREQPEPTETPDRVQLSVDGTMVPVVHGEFVEVKHLAIGLVTDGPSPTTGQGDVHATDVSYFAAHVPAERFTDLAIVETHRRGVERAREVVAVNDGATWIVPGFTDYHCPTAPTILDLGHAKSYVRIISQAAFGAETAAAAAWYGAAGDRLEQAGGDALLRDIAALHRTHPPDEEASKAVAYLTARRDQMRYPDYRAAGWPIGSGMVESGHKVVIEPRLCGAGRHWARHNVNPLCALRTVVCNDRWEEGWPEAQRRIVAATQARRRARQHQRRATTAPIALPTAGATATHRPSTTPSRPAAGLGDQSDRLLAASSPTHTTATTSPASTAHKPAPDHPWNKPLTQRASALAKARQLRAKS